MLHNKLIDNIIKLPDLTHLSNKKEIQDIARDFINGNITCILVQFVYPITMEGALKLKELFT